MWRVRPAYLGIGEDRDRPRGEADVAVEPVPAPQVRMSWRTSVSVDGVIWQCLVNHFRLLLVLLVERQLAATGSASSWDTTCSPISPMSVGRSAVNSATLTWRTPTDLHAASRSSHCCGVPQMHASLTAASGAPRKPC